LNNNLTPRRRKAVESLLTSGDVTCAALTAGISRETLYRWMKEEDFIQALKEAEAQALEGLSCSLVALGSKAANTLEAAMDDTDVPAAARINAARVVLDNLLRLRELVNLEERVSKLEAKK
jgi:phage terminase small subunit